MTISSNHLNDAESDCEAIRDLIPDYAFGLTDADTNLRIEAKLAGCPEAVEQLGDFRAMQAAMRTNVPLIEPSIALENRLMAAIGAPIVATAAARANPATARRPRSTWIGLSRVAGLVAAIAIVALAATNLYWLTRVNDLTTRQEALLTQLGGLGGAGSNAFVLTGTGDLRWVRLPASKGDETASAFLMWNAASEIGLMYAYGFPALAVGKTYQLWLTRGEERVSAGVFRVDGEGKGSLLFHVTQPIDKYTWARVTAEPSSGSDTPSGTIIAIGKLST